MVIKFICCKLAKMNSSRAVMCKTSSPSSKFLIEEKIDEYRQKIYSIIHDDRTVKSVYKQSFQPNRNSDFYSTLINRDRLKNQNQNRNRNHNHNQENHQDLQTSVAGASAMNVFSWQPYFTSQKALLTKCNGPTEEAIKTAKDPAEELQRNKQSFSQGGAATDPLGLNKKKHILSAPPSNSKTNSSNPVPRIDWASPIVASLNRASRTESDWLKSFETLQTKRSIFVNGGVTPRPEWEETVQTPPNHVGKFHRHFCSPVDESSSEPAKLIRHYSIYMPEIEIDDGKISIKSRTNSPIELDNESVEQQSDYEYDNKVVENAGETNIIETENELMTNRNELIPRTSEGVSITKSYVTTFHSFEFGHALYHAVIHTAFVQSESGSRSNDFTVSSSNRGAITLRIVPAPLILNEDREIKLPPISPANKRVLFSDQLETVRIIPGRQQRKTKTKKSSKKG